MFEGRGFEKYFWGKIPRCYDEESYEISFNRFPGYSWGMDFLGILEGAVRRLNWSIPGKEL